MSECSSQMSKQNIGSQMLWKVMSITTAETPDLRPVELGQRRSPACRVTQCGESVRARWRGGTEYYPTLPAAALRSLSALKHWSRGTAGKHCWSFRRIHRAGPAHITVTVTRHSHILSQVLIKPGSINRLSWAFDHLQQWKVFVSFCQYTSLKSFDCYSRFYHSAFPRLLLTRLGRLELGM